MGGALWDLKNMQIGNGNRHNSRHENGQVMQIRIIRNSYFTVRKVVHYSPGVLVCLLLLFNVPEARARPVYAKIAVPSFIR
jgi:hypothetical protein